MVRRDRRLVGEKFVPPTKFSPIFSSEKQAKEEFSALILAFPDKELASAADCSPETVKCWKQKRAFPNGKHMMALVADFPTIRAWHDRKTGGMHSPQGMSELFAHLERVMASDTAEGRAMRARFQQIVSGQ